MDQLSQAVHAERSYLGGLGDNSATGEERWDDLCEKTAWVVPGADAGHHASRFPYDQGLADLLRPGHLVGKSQQVGYPRC
jgi:hypothetical protein